MLLYAIDSGSNVGTFDIDGNGIVDNADTLELLSRIGSLAGDANLDGTVDAVDLNRVGLNWLSSNCAAWERGDFSGDGTVDATDLNILGLNWQQVAAAQQATNVRLPRAPLGDAAGDAATPVVAVGGLDSGIGESDIGEEETDRQNADRTPTRANRDVLLRRDASGRRIHRRTQSLQSSTSGDSTEVRNIDAVFAVLDVRLQ